MRGHVPDREVQVVDRGHVPDRAEQARHHVEAVGVTERAHVARVDEQPRAGDRRLLDHAGAGLDPFGALVPLGEPREMGAGAAADIEHRARVGPVPGDQPRDLLDLTAVVLVLVEEVVRLRGAAVGLHARGPYRVRPWVPATFRPAARRSTRAASTPGMRTRAPAGTSHSSAARSPCQRSEYETGPSFVGASRTSSGSPRHSRGNALEQFDVGALRVDERAADRVQERSRTAGRVSPHVVPRRAIRRSTGRLATGEHAEANPRGAGFVVEAPVFERDDHLRHRQPRLARQQELRARRVDRGLERGIGKLDPHPPVELGAPPARRPARRSGTLAASTATFGRSGRRNRRRVRCATGNRNAASSRARPVAPGLERVVARVAAA